MISDIFLFRPNYTINKSIIEFFYILLMKLYKYYSKFCFIFSICLSILHLYTIENLNIISNNRINIF